MSFRSFIAGLAALLTGCSSTTSFVKNGVPNLRQYGVASYRGGQPTSDGWQWLKSQGVTNVVKLNEISEASDFDAQNLGFYVSYLPISLVEQTVLRPVTKNVLAAAEMANRPGTYVHCEHGQDRTGLIIAVYRVQWCKWTKANAEAEMIANGFHKELHGLWDWWEDWKP